MIVTLLYVDDMLIFSDLDQTLKDFECAIRNAFAVLTCSDASNFVGIDLIWSSENVSLEIGQRIYSQSIVDRFVDLSKIKKPKKTLWSRISKRCWRKMMADLTPRLDL